MGSGKRVEYVDFQRWVRGGFLIPRIRGGIPIHWAYVSRRKKVPGAFLAVGGLIPWQEGDESSEVIIRRMRDS